MGFFYGFLTGIGIATALIIAFEIAKDYSLGDWFKDHVLVPLHLAKKS
jgi:hypothetical protein